MSGGFISLSYSRKNTVCTKPNLTIGVIHDLQKWLKKTLDVQSILELQRTGERNLVFIRVVFPEATAVIEAAVLLRLKSRKIQGDELRRAILA